MKKYLSLILGAFLVFFLVGCSTQTYNDTNDKNAEAGTLLAGQWQFNGYNTDQRIYNVVLNLEDDDNFELTVADEGTEEGSPDQKDAIAKGTYVANGQEFVLIFDEIDDPDGLINQDVIEDDEYLLLYDIGVEDDTLIFDTINELIPTLPSEVVFERLT